MPSGRRSRAFTSAIVVLSASIAGSGASATQPRDAHGAGADHRATTPTAMTALAAQNPAKKPSRKPPPAVAMHPLDPLTKAEILRTFALVEADARFAVGSFFPLVELQEPPKEEVLAWVSGRPFSRRAFAEVYDRPGNLLSEVIVDLGAGAVESWTPRPGDQPPLYRTEWVRADEVVRADPAWQAAIAARGLSPDDVHVDTWAPGDTTMIDNPDGHRLLRALAFHSRGGAPNPYPRPIEGLVVVIDMTDERVLSVSDSGAVPVATDEPGSPTTTRDPLPPLAGKPPRRSAISLSGRELAWQGWRMHVGWSPREGLVLSEIGYAQGDELRPIIHRLSLSEIYVPYGDPDPDWSWRTPFDVGEYALGQYAVPMQVGVDVPAGARFLDEVIAGDRGTAGGTWKAKHATAIWERADRATWSRTDPSSLARDARAGRQLVLSGEYAIRNDSYAVEYAFGLDGAIDVSVRAQGTVLAKGIVDGTAAPTSGTHLAATVGAPDHQHFIAFRIDFDVDGPANEVIGEQVARTPAGKANQFGVRATGFATERSADPDPSGGTSWRVVSATRSGALGRPTGYRLTPTDWTVPYSDAGFIGLKRAQFAVHPFWVTTYDPSERFAAGDHPISGATGGVGDYASPPEPIDGKDVVVWYTLGLTHHPETEEYPVMNGHTLGFRITPSGFFDRNPALDLPAP